MFGIASSEYLVILVVAILVLGPEHLPRIMRTAAKVMSNFRRITTELQRAINLESFESDLLSNKTTTSTKKKKKKTASKKNSTAKKDPCTEKPKKDGTSPSDSNQTVTIPAEEPPVFVNDTTASKSNENITPASLMEKENNGGTINTTATSRNSLPSEEYSSSAPEVKKMPESASVNSNDVTKDCSKEPSGATS